MEPVRHNLRAELWHGWCTSKSASPQAPAQNSCDPTEVGVEIAATHTQKVSGKTRWIDAKVATGMRFVSAASGVEAKGFRFR